MHERSDAGQNKYRIIGGTLETACANGTWTARVRLKSGIARKRNTESALSELGKRRRVGRRGRHHVVVRRHVILKKGRERLPRRRSTKG